MSAQPPFTNSAPMIRISRTRIIYVPHHQLVFSPCQHTEFNLLWSCFVDILWDQPVTDFTTQLSLSLSLCPSSFLQLSICGQLLPIKTFDVRWQTMERECNQLNWTIRPPSSRTDSVSCPCTYLLVYLLDKHHFAFHSRGLSFFLSLPPSNSVLIPVDLIFTFPRTLWFVQASRKQDLTRRRIESKSKPGKSPFITHTPSSSSSTSTSTIQWNIHEIGEQANHLLPSCKMTRQRLVTFPKLHSLQISIACYTTPPLSLWMAPQKSSFNGNRSRLPTKRVFNSVVVVSRENRMWEILCHYYYWSNERMNEWRRGWMMIFPGSFSGSPWHPFDRDGGGEK